MRAALVLFVAVLGLPLLTAADDVLPIDSVKQFVNIRAEANADSDVIGRLYQGDSMPLVRSLDGWREIQIEPGLNGFISADWTKVRSDADVAAEAEPAQPEPVPEISPEEVVEEAPAAEEAI